MSRKLSISTLGNLCRSNWRDCLRKSLSSQSPRINTTIMPPQSACCSGNDNPSHPASTTLQDIEDLHRVAVKQGARTYTDPETGFMVFTEVAHLQRGVCCGNQCRHCPYGWANVKSGARRTACIQSGDKNAAKVRLEELQRGEVGPQTDATATNTVNAAPKKAGKGGRHGGRTTSKNVPYTRSGDRGTSQLLTGERRAKDDAAFEAMGTVDELCTVVGVAHAEILADGEEKYGELSEYLLDIMSRLFDLGSHVAKPRKTTNYEEDDDEDDEIDFAADGVGGGFDADHVEDLEDWIDILTDRLPELTSFILPTGAKASAQLHVARTVCRRAERRVVGLVDAGVCDPNAMRYLNRLSDFFFTAARYVNYKNGNEEIQYRRAFRGAKQRHRQAVSWNEPK